MGITKLLARPLRRLLLRLLQSPAMQGCLIKGDSSLVSIGPSATFGGNVTILASCRVTIGEHAMIAYGCVIHTSEHNYARHPMWLQRIDRPVSIGDHTWIGTQAIILPGTTIDRYCVIGAGAVVKGHVPERAIVAGNPGRIIGYRNLGDIDLEAPVPDYPIGATIIEMPALDRDVKKRPDSLG